MKQTLIAGLASLVLAQGALGYTNQGIVINPDFNINDPVFVNDRGAQFLVYDQLDSPYRTYNTRYYTNDGLMEAFIGFQFDTFNPGNNLTETAGSFYNGSSGIVSNTLSLFNPSVFLAGKCIVNASNVINRGQINVGREGQISISGERLDLTRGRLSVAAFENSLFSTDGMFDYWGWT